MKEFICVFVLIFKVSLSYGYSVSDEIEKKKTQISSLKKERASLIRDKKSLLDHLSEVEKTVDNFSLQIKNYNQNQADQYRELKKTVSIFSTFGKTKVESKKEAREIKLYTKCLSKFFVFNLDRFKSYFSSCAPPKNTSIAAQGYLELIKKTFDFLSLKKIDLEREKQKHLKTALNIKLKLNSNKREVVAVNLKLDDEIKKMKSLEDKQEQKSYIEKRFNYFSCDRNTKTLDLEQEYIAEDIFIKGAFYNKKRDFQGSMGTCYANTAKNLLIGLSRGDVEASFLDIALQYKNGASALKGQTSDLYGGFSCEALEKIKSLGYCPAKYSLVEGAASNNSLHVNSQAQLLKVLDKYITARESISKIGENGVLSLLRSGKKLFSIINKDKLNLPFPKLVDLPISRNEALSHFLHSLKGVKVDKDDFLISFDKAKNMFLFNYYTAYLNESLSFNNVKKMYLSYFGDFIKKYKLESRLNMTYTQKKIMNLTKISSSFNYRKDEISKSVEFYKSHFSSEEILEVLQNESYENLSSSLSWISKNYKNLNIPLYIIERYLQSDISDTQSILNFIAPKCLDKGARRELGFDFKCERKNIEKHRNKVHSISEKITLSLIKGMPVGNIFSASVRERHINTIVGRRFNIKKSHCELKIRESMTGKSTWESESRIINSMEDVVTVDRY